MLSTDALEIMTILSLVPCGSVPSPSCIRHPLISLNCLITDPLRPMIAPDAADGIKTLMVPTVEPVAEVVGASRGPTTTEVEDAEAEAEAEAEVAAVLSDETTFLSEAFTSKQYRHGLDMHKYAWFGCSGGSRHRCTIEDGFRLM